MHLYDEQNTQEYAAHGQCVHEHKNTRKKTPSIKQLQKNTFEGVVRLVERRTCISEEPFECYSSVGYHWRVNVTVYQTCHGQLVQRTRYSQ